MRRYDEGGGVLSVHRILDPGDRFVAVLAEIAENAHETRPELSARARKGGPIHDCVGVLGQLGIPSSGRASTVSGATLGRHGKQPVDAAQFTCRRDYAKRGPRAARAPHRSPAPSGGRRRDNADTCTAPPTPASLTSTSSAAA